uniref:hypothetical protein n=1 Tax=Roseomonas rosulenta TaxID=2748667 RepID=UPI001E5DFAF8
MPALSEPVRDDSAPGSAGGLRGVVGCRRPGPLRCIGMLVGVGLVPWLLPALVRPAGAQAVAPAAGVAVRDAGADRLAQLRATLE